MKITERINLRQPKYVLPAIIFIPLLVAGYFFIDMFNTKIVKTEDNSLQTTEFLNPDLPGAQIKNGDGIGGKYENMERSYGHIDDYTAVDNIERDNKDDENEDYQSRYSQEEVDDITRQTEETDTTADKEREAQALADLDKMLAEARLRGRTVADSVAADSVAADSAATIPPSKEEIHMKGEVSSDGNARRAPGENDAPREVVKAVRATSDYFNTVAENESELRLIKAIIDEDVHASDGSRVRLRLLDDITVGVNTIPAGTCLYATVSGFSSERVKGSITSVLVGDDLIKISLSVYDTDGMEGLYVPGSQFRETTKDIASGAASGNISMNTTSTNSLTQWGLQAAQNAYQKTSSAISKAIKKNRAKLKYGTFVYLVNGKEKKE